MFSVGLAVTITMVTAGVVVSISVEHLQNSWSGFGAFARRAPHASGVLMLLITLPHGLFGLGGPERDSSAGL